MFRRISLFLFTVSFILFSGCGDKEELERETLEPSPLPVTASVASIDVLYEVISSTGRVSSRRTQTLTAQIQGQIVQAPEYEGEEFSEGEVIFRVASGQHASNLSAANSEYRNAQALYQFEIDNYRGEITDGVRSMLRQTTGLEAASASLSSARTQYGNSAVAAGFNGVISDVTAQDGMTVYPGSPLGTLVDPWSLQVEVNLDERQLARCTPGLKAFVIIPSLNDTVLVGEVRSVSPVIDPSFRSGTVVVDVPHIPNLRPGATARTEIVFAEHEGSLVIPEQAVLIRDDRPMVFAVTDGHADWRYVTLGPAGRGFVSVTDGITEGETVITSGHYSLAHDAPVAVVN
ncbi:MAG: efflux RND transporter periplasmic adaptor subunit [Candidatus Fermentibacteraceae bacterium]|nr:efflux RND transporter periplasmic adaptor subunit [Candidatus Fermentibacteraceae bacterium]